MSIVVKGRGIALDVEGLSDGVVRVSLNGAVVGALTSAGAISATTLSASSLSWGDVSGATMTATTITATTISATNDYVTTVTATNVSATNIKVTTVTGTTFSGTDIKATQITATTFCAAAGATSFAFSGTGGSATIGAQVLTANSFLKVFNGTTASYIPVFTTIATS